MGTKLTVGALALGLAGPAWAGTTDDVQAELQDLKARVEQQDREIQQLRTSSGESWLNERRSEEIKSLVHEVLADAETRASLQEGGLTAGWRDHFFLASEDGNFLLRVSGQSQTRYIYSHSNDPNRNGGIPFNNEAEEAGEDFDEADDDQNVEGFQQRRTKVRFDGHLFDPKFTYAVQMNATFDGGEEPEEDIGSARHDNGGGFDLEDAWAAYEFADGWQLKVGQFKAPFLRDELVDSKYQLAVERAYVTDYLTVDRTQGVQVAYNGELSGAPIRAAVMIHDGSYMANTDFDNDLSDFAIAGRVELLAAGAWEQFDDYASWSGDAVGILIGAAVDYENGARGGGDFSTDNFDIFKWTVDASVEVPEAWGFNAFAAFIGQHLSQNTGDPDLPPDDADQYAVVLQAGVFVVPDKWDVFARYEWMDFDGAFFMNVDNFGAFHDFDDISGADDENDNVDLLTFGTNYYFKKHAAKASVDLVWSIDQLSGEGNSGAGLNQDGDDDQFAIRGQFQFLF